MANLPALVKTVGKNTGILSSNQAPNAVSSGKDFAYSIISGVSKMLSPQTYTGRNVNRAMLKKTGIAKDVAEGRVTKGRGKDGVYEGVSHMDRLKLAHMNSDGTYNKSAIAGSILTAGAAVSGATHAAFGEDGIAGVPLI